MLSVFFHDGTCYLSFSVIAHTICLFSTITHAIYLFSVIALAKCLFSDSIIACAITEKRQIAYVIMDKYFRSSSLLENSEKIYVVHISDRRFEVKTTSFNSRFKLCDICNSFNAALIFR